MDGIMILETIQQPIIPEWASLTIGAICMTILFVMGMFAYAAVQDKHYIPALFLCFVGMLAGIGGWAVNDLSYQTQTFYKAEIDTTASLVEFNEKYEIVKEYDDYVLIKEKGVANHDN